MNLAFYDSNPLAQGALGIEQPSATRTLRRLGEQAGGYAYGSTSRALRVSITPARSHAW